MTFQGVPWAVGGGALNTVEAARLAAYVATNGAAGVVLPADCEVRESAVPDGNVQVRPGSIVIPNGAAGTSAESYLGKNVGLHPVAIAATGAGGGRSDLVYVGVSDPQYAGQPAPADVETGPYIAPKVCAGVLPSTRSVQDAIDQGALPAGTTGEGLALVTIPASTATVTQAMITDLRRMANPRGKIVQRIVNPTTSAHLVVGAWKTFPTGASWSVDIPSWATKCVVQAVVNSVPTSGVAYGSVRAKIGSAASQSQGWRAENGAQALLMVTDTIAISAVMRGTTQTCLIEGQIGGSSTGDAYEWEWTSGSLTLNFYEDAASGS